MTDLAVAISRAVGQHSALSTRLPGLNLYRSATTVVRTPMVYVPTICLIAQGRKQVHYGDKSCSYDPSHYLINSLTLPIEAEILDVTPGRPYLGLSLAVDPQVVSQLMLELDRHLAPPASAELPDIIAASGITRPLEHAFIRLLGLLESPLDLEILGPGIQREIFYEVLKGPHGHLLRNCVASHAGASRIAPVVHFIEKHFEQPLDIDAIAQQAGMSASSLHAHFKEVTSLSPMQFVKSLRLHRAHMLLLSGQLASEASYRVGYGSPSQFSREFKRFFGVSPRDVQTRGAA
ncbi:AraC family transcriptional regulator [Marinobacterium nitratireducens]|nr:AraC family transcriptional regulator [Marinobacterium nitratireducens]